MHVARVGGRIYSVAIANPAAGANAVIKPPTTRLVWEVLAVNFVLTTGATVANRCAGLIYQDGLGHGMGVWRSNVLQAASLVKSYTGPGYGSGDPQATGTIVIPMPEGIRLGSDTVGRWSLATNIHAIQATDQVSGVEILVEEVDL